MKSPELKKILKDHSLWLRTYGKKGTQLDLSRADLSGADLTEVDMRDVNLGGTDLRGADLTGARLPQGTDD
jgi:uncharacterized protein YjbI with pentapeptide repeats